MYHCHVQLYLVGDPCRVFEIIKEIAPLPAFIHTFVESEKPEEDLAARADVILVDLHGGDWKEAVRFLLDGKKETAELILLADSGQISDLAEYLPEIGDIWTTPMTDEEVGFRFRKWQQDAKRKAELWQTSHYLEAAINNSPNLIWYKDKRGIHEKVNDSFCKAVNKTKQQVEGRSHAYIWDVEQDDPACIESERVVMTQRKTCMAEETIQTGAGKRLLTTYKSPLYDLDGSVMGTVGIGIDVTQERVYEKEIISKNHMLETIFTSMECGVMCHTLDGQRIISVNQAALTILGYDSQEEMLAAGFDTVAASVLESDRDILRKRIRSLKKEGDSVSVEYRVLHRDGGLRHVMGNIKLLKENGELFYQRFLLDCTAQKLQEERNERHQMELIQALSIEYNLVCYYELNTGRGMSIRIADGYREKYEPFFAGNISLTDSLEQYIEKFVYEEDRSIDRKASCRERV